MRGNVKGPERPLRAFQIDGKAAFGGFAGTSLLRRARYRQGQRFFQGCALS